MSIHGDHCCYGFERFRYYDETGVLFEIRCEGDITPLYKLAFETGIARHQRQKHYATSTPFAKNHDAVGLVGEAAFAAMFDLPLNLHDRPGGDTGYDNVLEDRELYYFTVDVKTGRRMELGLLVKKGKVRADIFVAAQYIDEGPYGAVQLLGWVTSDHVLKAPLDELPSGLNHRVQISDLSDMSELRALVGWGEWPCSSQQL